MRQHWDQREGILLQAIPYLETRRILKVFTKDVGILSMMASSKKVPFATPFCRAEWVFRKSSGDIHSLKEGSLLDPLLHLRESYGKIQAAGSIASDLLRSQMANKASEGLYDLLLASFTHLAVNPQAVAQSFRLKLLQFEGLVQLQRGCMCCGAMASSLSGGESLCISHADNPKRQTFNQEEWQQLLTLGLARRFSEFASLLLSPAFLRKVSDLFFERIH
jgi:DNA repair protein RecO